MEECTPNGDCIKHNRSGIQRALLFLKRCYPNHRDAQRNSRPRISSNNFRSRHSLPRVWGQQPSSWDCKRTKVQAPNKTSELQVPSFQGILWFLRDKYTPNIHNWTTRWLSNKITRVWAIWEVTKDDHGMVMGGSSRNGYGLFRFPWSERIKINSFITYMSVTRRNRTDEK